MDALPASLITRMFNDIEAMDDPRADNARHFLTDILVIAMLAVLSGLDDFPGIVEYANDECDFLKTFLRLPHGIRSVSTFRRVFGMLKPSVLLNVMQRWSGELAGTMKGRQIAVDGKTLRRSFERAWDKSGLHLVTAWCVEGGLVMAQQADFGELSRVVDEKSNEITAIPRLIQALDIKGATVTIDAMGTQTDIAQQIVKGGGDYVLAVKDNHPTLCDTIQKNMNDLILEKFRDVSHVYHETTEAGHGRIDTRRVWATDQIDWLRRREEWKNLTSVIVVESIRRIIGTNQTQIHRRYFISSLKSDSGERFAKLIRNHWSIENSQHWTLDTAFNEDQSRVRKDHDDQNLAVLRRIALGLLRRNKSIKLGARNKRLKAGRNRNYLFKVLLSTPEAK